MWAEAFASVLKPKTPHPRTAQFSFSEAPATFESEADEEQGLLPTLESEADEEQGLGKGDEKPGPESETAWSIDEDQRRVEEALFEQVPATLESEADEQQGLVTIVVKGDEKPGPESETARIKENQRRVEEDEFEVPGTKLPETAWSSVILSTLIYKSFFSMDGVIVVLPQFLSLGIAVAAQWFLIEFVRHLTPDIPEQCSSFAGEYTSATSEDLPAYVVCRVLLCAKIIGEELTETWKMTRFVRLIPEVGPRDAELLEHSKTAIVLSNYQDGAATPVTGRVLTDADCLVGVFGLPR